MAEAQAVWQPSEQGANEICSLLREFQNPNVDQSKIVQELERCRQYPEFNNYLAFILCRGENQPVEVRQSAGLVLKNSLKAGLENVNPAYLSYIKSELLRCIGLPDRALRNTVGTAISTIVEQQGARGLGAWPELLQGIVQCLESNDHDHTEGALDALYKMCEDMPMQLDKDIPGLGERPVNVFLPRLLHLFTSPHENHRRLAVASVNQFIIHMPRALLINMDSYLKALFSLCSDPSPSVRRLVCAAIVQFIELQPDFLHPHMRSVMEFMLHSMQDNDSDVALEACEFWSAYCDSRQSPEALREFLPRLVPILLSNMVYSEDDEAVAEAEEDESTPDTDQDLKPRFHQSRLHGGGADEEEEDDEAVSAWNLRKCSAAALDILSTVFGDEILPLLMPVVQAKLSDSREDTWRERESAVLAVGAVAEGCIGGLLPALPQIIARLLPLLSDKHPLVRSITCWSLSRYSKWVVAGVEKPEGHAEFDAVLQGILARILDSNKRVQEAACSAFATLEEEAVEELPSRLEPILQHLMFAFGKYQRSNMRILYDALGTLADCVTSELQQPQYVAVIMPPLLAKWQELPDNDRDLVPLLECLTSVSKALGPAFHPYVETIFGRACRIVRTQIVAEVDPAAAGCAFEPELVVCSLDLIAGMVEAMGTPVGALLTANEVVDMAVRCCSSQVNDVRQSALALFGDTAKACPQQLQPRLAEVLGACVAQLQGPEAFEHSRISVANNACWAIGELAAKLRGEVAPVVSPTLANLVPLLTSAPQNPNGSDRSLLENTAITVGRLAWVCTDQVAPALPQFLLPFLNMLRLIRDDVEKEDAFRGLCALLRSNPMAAANAMPQLLLAIASWREIYNPDLNNELRHLLHSYKQLLMESGNWAQLQQATDPAVWSKLSAVYGM